MRGGAHAAAWFRATPAERHAAPQTSGQLVCSRARKSCARKVALSKKSPACARQIGPGGPVSENAIYHAQSARARCEGLSALTPTRQPAGEERRQRD